MRRALGVLAALVLLGGVTYALIPDSGPGPTKLVTVTGLIGSEKRAFFENQQVKDELAKQGLEVRADSTGSWTMSDKAKQQTDLDFAFPASAAPVKEIQHIWGLQDSPLVPFYSPLVIVTHAPVARVLQENNLATLDDSDHGVWTFKMDAYLAALKSGRKWQDLVGAAAHPELSGTIFVTTTDPQSSSSGAMYIALLSYILNNRQVVSDQAGIDATKDVLHTATALQGGQKSSSDEPFKDFGAGVGNPLVFAYESQVAQLALSGTSTGDMVVMYPDTTIYSDHTVVARSANGQKLASLLQDDEELRRLEARFGFRPQADPSAFAKAVQGKKPDFAPDLTAAKVKQPQVPAQDYLLKLVAAAKGNAQ
ncbi:substrate-binding domain-containing protein [Kitasatospora aureofaciens]|uniref:substrate-binding domain-containing protein n=1 Tax=Kitasatospora aureofaciens TaxID=1894 RepID=UPI001C44EA3B|nr:substrate-binding domain-containing protein [Kitasatospora aureofaciens]MBV6699478.1 substrate-binding domain-containing protein [Kitasatospora aureofaciens]